MQKFDLERKALISQYDMSVKEELEAAAQKTEPPATEMSKNAQALKKSLISVDSSESEAALKNSLAGRIGTSIEGISRFAGFDWRTNIALVGGFAAKEVVISTLGTAYSLGETDPDDTDSSLSDTLANSPNWSPLTALSLIVFTILYAPCFVTVVVIARESGSWKWGAFSMIFNTLLALTLSILVFQIGSFMSL